MNMLMEQILTFLGKHPRVWEFFFLEKEKNATLNTGTLTDQHCTFLTMRQICQVRKKIKKKKLETQEDFEYMTLSLLQHLAFPLADWQNKKTNLHWIIYQ